MRIDKKIIMWELSLKCNLTCSFCYQKDRRVLQKTQINLETAKKIASNLPKNSHIAFIWWESFLFPWFMELLIYMDNLWVTYEITTNGTLIEKNIDNINKLKNITNINFSVDYFGENQDRYRDHKWLFSKIVEAIPKLKKKININTVLFEDSSLNDLIKIHLFFDKLWIQEHTFLMYSSFSEDDLRSTQGISEELNIKTKPEDSIIDYIELKKKSLSLFKEIYNIHKMYNLKSKPIFIPQWLLTHKNTCKHLDNQYRINENWKISICHYIDNEFDDIASTSFESAIKNKEYIEIKEKIRDNFPLGVCRNCCKIL